MRLFIAVLAFLALAVTAAPIRESNGARMARGLPPLPPKFGRNLPGILEPRASPVAAAKRSTPSSSPPATYSGRINVRTSDGSSLGFVRNSASGSINGVNFLGPDQDLHVSFTSGAGPFDILATDPAFPPPFFVGARGTATSDTITFDSPETVAFTNVEQTPPSSVPVNSPTGGVVESAIWSFDPVTKELTAHYVNPAGPLHNTNIVYDIRANVLFFSGDLAAYNAANPDTPASVVKFFLA